MYICMKMISVELPREEKNMAPVNKMMYSNLGMAIAQIVQSDSRTTLKIISINICLSAR